MDESPVESPLGLSRGKAEVHEYDPRWAALFDAESAMLRSALGGSVAGIEHVGSTAIVGLAAKPVLDIAVALEDESQFDGIRAALEDAGYEYRGDLGDEGGRIFVKWTELARTHHVHLVAAGSDQWRDYLGFRDALRRHPDLRERYAALKWDLASRFASDRDSYIAGKHDFIRETLRRHQGSPDAR